MLIHVCKFKAHAAVDGVVHHILQDSHISPGVPICKVMEHFSLVGVLQAFNEGSYLKAVLTNSLPLSIWRCREYCL